MAVRKAASPGTVLALEGWHYALERKDLLGTYLIDMNAMFFGMPNALFPAFGALYGEQYVGLLYAAGPAGALLISLTSGWTKSISRHGLAIAGAAAPLPSKWSAT